MKRALLILLALLICAPACEKKTDDDSAKTEESEKSDQSDESTDEPDEDQDEDQQEEKAAPELEPPSSTDDSNEPGGFRTPAEIALRELPFEPCRQVHKTSGDGQLIRTFEHVYEDGKLMSKLNLTADDTVRAAWTYEYDEEGQRIRAMRDDTPEGREMIEPDLIISYEWKDGKLTNSAWAFAKEPDKTWRNTFKYNDDGRLVRMTSDGFPADPPRDDNNPRVWTHEYDEKGYLMRRTRRPKDGESPTRYTEFSYADGKLAQQTHRAALQGEWKMQYDANFSYDDDNLAAQTLEWGHADFGTEAVTYEYECE